MGDRDTDSVYLWWDAKPALHRPKNHPRPQILPKKVGLPATKKALQPQLEGQKIPDPLARLSLSVIRPPS